MLLGTKLRIGFVIPVAMLLTAGLWSFLRFDALSRSVNAMLSENDRSIRAATGMVLALERMDSAALHALAGRSLEMDPILAAADSAFAASLRDAEENVTIAAEPAILDSVRAAHGTFRESLDAMARAPDFATYSNELLPAFLDAKHEVGRLRRVNETEMEERALEIGRHAYRASLPAAILAIGAFLFMAMFAWLTRGFVVRPLRLLLQRTSRWAESGDYESGGIETGDELQSLDANLARVDEMFSRRRDQR